MKKIIVLIFALSICATAISCKGNENDFIEKQSINSVAEQIEEDFSNVKESLSSSQSEGDSENSENKGANLDLSNCAVNFPEDLTQIFELRLQEQQDRSGVNREFFDIFTAQLEFFFPDLEINNDYIYISSLSGQNGYYNDISNILDDLQSDIYMLDYRSPDVYLCAFNTQTVTPQRVNNGVITRAKTSSIDYSAAPDMYLGTWYVGMNSELKAVYVDNGQFNDISYPLLSGDVTIGEAIDYFENEYCNNLPFDYSYDMEIDVSHVEVYPLQRDNYYYGLSATLAYKGMPFCTGFGTGYSIGTTDDGRDFVFVDIKAAMANKDEIDFVMFTNDYVIEEVGKPIENIIDLEQAIQIASNSLSSEVTFEVQKIEFVYQTTREPIENFDSKPPIIAEPAWRFDAYNTNDGKNYVIFINAQTGELQYFKWWGNSD